VIDIKKSKNKILKKKKLNKKQAFFLEMAEKSFKEGL